MPTISTRYAKTKERAPRDFIRIRAALDALDAGFSQRTVAKAAGIPRTTLRDIKDGRRQWFNEGLKQ